MILKRPTNPLEIYYYTINNQMTVSSLKYQNGFV